MESDTSDHKDILVCLSCLTGYLLLPYNCCQQPVITIANALVRITHELSTTSQRKDYLSDESAIELTSHKPVAQWDPQPITQMEVC